VTPEELDAWVAQDRARQGLPAHVEDPAAVALVAAFLDDPGALGADGIGAPMGSGEVDSESAA
jgi:hypothetical protein